MDISEGVVILKIAEFCHILHTEFVCTINKTFTGNSKIISGWLLRKELPLFVTSEKSLESIEVDNMLTDQEIKVQRDLKCVLLMYLRTPSYIIHMKNN